MQLVDLSVSIRNHSFEGGSPHIHRTNHAEAARRRAGHFGFQPSEFPDGLGMATDQVTLATHAGTHVDAPLHYGPLCEGLPAKSIDQVPLEWCYGAGFVLNMTHKNAGDHITASDVADAVGLDESKVKGCLIALVRTDASQYFDSPDFTERHPGLDASAVDWLLDRGVRTIGIDAWGLDRPAKLMAADHKRGIPNSLWPAHMHGRKREYLHIERLANLSSLPSFGFTVVAFPVKIEGATAGWSRVVALVP